MSNKAGEFNLTQINYMKHAIGYESRKVKRRAYKAWRNYFTTSEPETEWENLVELGLATKRHFVGGIGENPTVYFVSPEGLIFLGELLGIKITETD